MRLLKNRSYPKDVLDDRDYKYFLYNKNKVTDEDFKAIQEYISQFGNKYISILKDVSECKTAIEIYKILRKMRKRGQAIYWAFRYSVHLMMFRHSI